MTLMTLMTLFSIYLATLTRVYARDYVHIIYLNIYMRACIRVIAYMRVRVMTPDTLH